MIRECRADEFHEILELINATAEVYKGSIPDDCWHEPYMPAEQLERDMDQGVVFYGYYDNGRLTGVMGIQEVGETTLIRHAYVAPKSQGRGIGGRLLTHLKQLAKTKRVLVGTWATNQAAIGFYEKHGFRLLDREQSRALLKRYWSIPQCQVESSVVLELT